MANAMFAMFEPLPLSGDEDEADACDCGEECAAMKRRRARKRRAAPVPRKTPALVPLDADGDLEPQRREVRARSARVVVEPTRGDYLRTPLRLLPDRILDGSGRAVMMRWEEPIMRAHADTLRCAGADVLNIGFGMGLIDGAISDAAPRSHTIVEAHPDILAAMRSAGWTARATIVDGRWQAPPTQQHAGPATACDPGPTAQERLCDLGTYDAIFYDTFDEGLDTFDLFCSALPALLRPGGTFSWFNGFGGHSARAHSAASERAARLLDAIGCAISLSRAPCHFHRAPPRAHAMVLAVASRPTAAARRRLECRYQLTPIETPPADVWEGVCGRYYALDAYLLPTATWADRTSEPGSSGSPRGEQRDATDTENT